MVSGYINGAKETGGSSKHWVLVLGWLTMGGAERQALILAEGLVKRGQRVTVIGLSSPGRVMDECRERGITCHLWKVDWNAPMASLLRRLVLIARWFRGIEPTYIVPYGMAPNVVMGAIWRFTGAKACVWQQREEGGRFRRVGGLEKFAVRSLPAFISNSSHATKWIVEELGVPRRSIRIIRNGVKKPKASSRGAWRSGYNIPADVFMVSMIANIHRYKDHETLLLAWERILSSVPDPDKFLLVLAGTHGDAYEKVQAFMSHHGRMARLIAPGSVSNVNDLINDSDLLVFSSHFEGVPNGVLEGMAHGKAVVASDIPGVREALGELADRQTVPRRDATRLAARMLELINDPSERAALGALNKRRLEEYFSVDGMVEDTMQVMFSAADTRWGARASVNVS